MEEPEAADRPAPTANPDPLKAAGPAEKPKSAAPPQRLGRFLLAGPVIVLATWLAWQWWLAPAHPGDEDDLPPFHSPYQNTRADVKYVGDTACIQCHEGHVETYHEHPMGRSLAPIGSSLPWDRPDAARGGSFLPRVATTSVGLLGARTALGPSLAAALVLDPRTHNSFTARGLEYRVERRGRRLFHSETRRNSRGQIIAHTEREIQYVLGSGRRGYGYLIHENGFLCQSPISWYSQKRRWDLSPGYEHSTEHFERPITGECLFCHANSARETGPASNRFKAPIFRGYAIGCERCHGPGELHVRLRQSGAKPKRDWTIVNPRHLEPPLREAVCQQCHLQGKARVLRAGRQTFDFRPGMPLHLYWSIFVERPGMSATRQAVGQVEQMALSQCYRGSKGQLGCISCHDPHVAPSEAARVGFYRKRCQTCHEKQGCNQSLEVRQRRKGNDCTACHMPRFDTDNIAHTALTDHRILRDPAQEEEVEHSPRSARAGDRPLISFHRDLLDRRDKGVLRDEGLALTILADSLDNNDTFRTFRSRLGELALPLLEEAVKRRPNDAHAWRAKGFAENLQDLNEDALDSYNTALARAPRLERALVDMARLTAELGQHQRSLVYWKRAVEVAPYRANYVSNLAYAYTRAGEWEKASKMCQEALRISPAYYNARMLLMVCYFKLKERRKARAQYDILLGFDPPEVDRERLQRDFARFDNPKSDE